MENVWLVENIKYTSYPLRLLLWLLLMLLMRLRLWWWRHNIVVKIIWIELWLDFWQVSQTLHFYCHLAWCVSQESLFLSLVSCTPVSMLLSPGVWELLPLQGPDRDCSHARHCTDCPSAGARDVSRHRSQVWTPGSGHWLLFSGSPAKLKMFCCYWNSSTRSFIESVI